MDIQRKKTNKKLIYLGYAFSFIVAGFVLWNLFSYKSIESHKVNRDQVFIVFRCYH